MSKYMYLIRFKRKRSKIFYIVECWTSERKADKRIDILTELAGPGFLFSKFRVERDIDNIFVYTYSIIQEQEKNSGF